MPGTFLKGKSFFILTKQTVIRQNTGNHGRKGIIKMNEKGLTGSTLKWIAIVTMLIDHTGAAVLEKCSSAENTGKCRRQILCIRRIWFCGGSEDWHSPFSVSFWWKAFYIRKMCGNMPADWRFLLWFRKYRLTWHFRENGCLWGIRTSSLPCLSDFLS